MIPVQTAFLGLWTPKREVTIYCSHADMTCPKQSKALNPPRSLKFRFWNSAHVCRASESNDVHSSTIQPFQNIVSGCVCVGASQNRPERDAVPFFQPLREAGHRLQKPQKRPSFSGSRGPLGEKNPLILSVPAFKVLLFESLKLQFPYQCIYSDN